MRIRLLNVPNWLKAVLENRFTGYLYDDDNNHAFQIYFSDKSLEYSTQYRAEISANEIGFYGNRSDFDFKIDLAEQSCELRLLEGSWPGFLLVFKVCLSLAAVIENSILVHAASLRIDASGYLFPGKSGAGKSTIVKNLNGRTVCFSDELSIVSVEDKIVRIYPSPFFGELSSSLIENRVELVRIIFPDREVSLGLSEISKSEAAFRLMQDIVGWGLELMDDRLLNTCTEIVQSSENYTLNYRLGITSDELEALLRKDESVSYL